MFLDKGLIDQIRYVAYAHGMAGNKADRWGLSHLEPPKSQPTLESKPGWCANMFLDKGFVDQIRCCLCARDGREPCRTMQIGGDFRTLNLLNHKLHRHNLPRLEFQHVSG